ncbi:MAG: ABC transporter permease, partial [Caldilineaceae bacterium]|nr:ABC transporter permease [Caldilineaceae bacterium]
MFAYFVRRLIYMFTTMVFISFIGFFIINLPPGSYIDVFQAQRQNMGTSTAAAELEALKRRYGLDQPIYVQYWKWISGFVQGDFGRSFQYNREVKDLIWERLAFTAVIATSTLIFIWLVAIPLGIYSATHQYKMGDNVATIMGMAGLSIPDFMLALVLMVIAQRVFGFSVGGLFSREYVDAAWSFAKFVDL